MWVGQVSHGQESSQVGGAGLTGRHHKWVGQVSHRQAFQQILITLRDVLHIYNIIIYIYYIDTILV